MYFNALQELKLIKDAAERALGLVTEFHNNIVMCNTNQQQHIYWIVRDIREKQWQQVENGRERIT